MHTMTDAQAAKFVAALDKVDSALTAIRHEFEDLARQSAERLAALKAGGGLDNLSTPRTDHCEAATA